MSTRKPHEEEWAIEDVIVMHNRDDGQKEAREVLGHAAPDMARALRGHFVDSKTGHLKTCGGACDQDCADVRAALTKAGVILP